MEKKLVICFLIFASIVCICISIILACLFENNINNNNNYNIDKSEKSGIGDISINSTKGDTFNKKPIFIIDRLMKILNIKRFVIWGHSLGSHTHSYIHEGIYEACVKCDIPVEWVPQKTYHEKPETCVYSGDVKGSLFITEGQVIDGMPISNDAFYVFHNCDSSRVDISVIETDRKINIQYYTKESREKSFPLQSNFQRLSIVDRHLYLPWATNLVDSDFYDNVSKFENKTVNIVGQDGPSYHAMIDKFMEKCPLKLDKISSGLSSKDAIDHLRKGFISPTIVLQFQKDVGYIPCRIMKNTSYGLFPVTNSLESSKMLHGQVIVSDKEEDLYEKFIKCSNRSQILERCKSLVKNQHTYVNRIELILRSFFVSNNFKETGGNVLESRTQNEKIKVLYIGKDSYISKVADIIGWQLIQYQNEKHDVTIMDIDKVVEYHKLEKDAIVWNYGYDYQNPILNEIITNNDSLTIITNSEGERQKAIEHNVVWKGSFADLCIEPENKYSLKSWQTLVYNKHCFSLKEISKVTVSLQGGLGNQLFQIAAAIAYSKDNAKKFVMDTTVKVLEGVTPRNTYFDKFSFIEHDKYFISTDLEEKNFSYSKPSFIEGNVRMKGYFQSPLYFQEYRCHIVSAFVNSLKTSLKIPTFINSSNATCLHIRRTDYLNLELHTNLTHDYYKKGIDHIVDTLKTNINIVVFSDDLGWCKKNLSWIKFPLYFCEAGEDVDQMYMMSLCRHHIIANSSFSWWGAYLSPFYDDGITIAPRNWFTDKSVMTLDVYPKSWVVI